VTYLIMIYGDPESPGGWRTDAGLVEDLTESGKMIVAVRLAGPQAYLSGFFLIECESIGRAVARLRHVVDHDAADGHQRAPTARR